MKIKILYREYDGVPIQSFWDQNTKRWWYSCADIIKVLANSKEPRIYWHVIKTRNPILTKYIKKLTLIANDNKKRLIEAINQDGINELLYIIPIKDREAVRSWLKGLIGPADLQSKQKAYSLWFGNILKNMKPGTMKCLQQIHSYLFDGIYGYAGKLRTINLSKGGFQFTNCMHFDKIIPNVEKMSQKTIKEIVQKYIEMNIVHPFREGNGRATRIWLDLILKQELKKCVNWSKISKEDYFSAMVVSPYNSKPIFNLINDALTDKINDREIFMKGIDTSYYYEEVE